MLSHIFSAFNLNVIFLREFAFVWCIIHLFINFAYFFKTMLVELIIFDAMPGSGETVVNESLVSWNV